MFGTKRWGWAVCMIAALLLAACSSAAPRSASAPMDQAGAPEPMAQAPGGGEAAAEANRKIVATANISLSVADTQAVVDEIAALMDEIGGYVSTTNLSRRSYDSTMALQGSLTLRVPAESLDATLDRLSEMAIQVDSRSINREDITDQYSDVDAQLRNLEATEVELRAMLEETRERPGATSEDIMSVYRTLTEVRGQIEQLRGRKNMWDNLISLSTVNVTIYPDSSALPVVDDSWRPGVVARDAQRALVDGLQMLGNIAIWTVIVLLPLLLLALIPLVIFVWVLRLLFRRLSKPKPAPAVTAGPPAA